MSNDVLTQSAVQEFCLNKIVLNWQINLNKNHLIKEWVNKMTKLTRLQMAAHVTKQFSILSTMDTIGQHKSTEVKVIIFLNKHQVFFFLSFFLLSFLFGLTILQHYDFIFVK